MILIRGWTACYPTTLEACKQDAIAYVLYIFDEVKELKIRIPQRCFSNGSSPTMTIRCSLVLLLVFFGGPVSIATSALCSTPESPDIDYRGSMLATYEKIHGRGARHLSHTPPRSEISAVCRPLAESNTVLWIGGPPGSGKTTIAKRLSVYGFAHYDCEIAPINANLKQLQRLSLAERGAAVFGACYSRFLKHAPAPVVPVLLLPTKDVYAKRWHAREAAIKIDFPGFVDRQGHTKLWEQASKMAANTNDKRLVVIHQSSDDECVDATILRICQAIK